MRTMTYAKRNFKELLSDPLSLAFILGLPIFLLIFMVTLNKSFSFNDAFSIENFLPSTIVFSFTFLTMFCGLLVAKDRNSSFLSRMMVSPLKPTEYILGYMLPMIVIALIQIIILYLSGIFMGLEVNIHLFIALGFLLIISLLFISFGLLFGSLLKDQQVGPIVSILIQVVAFMSGMWFSLEMIGGAYEVIAYILPFAHGVDLLRDVMAGNYQDIWLNLFVVLIYIAFISVFAIYVFRKRMKK